MCSPAIVATMSKLCLLEVSIFYLFGDSALEWITMDSGDQNGTYVYRNIQLARHFDRWPTGWRWLALLGSCGLYLPSRSKLEVGQRTRRPSNDK